MRISTSQIHTLGVLGMLNQQVKLSQTQQQLSTGRRFLTPAEDPSGATRELDLRQTLEVNKQYQRNADQARARLDVEEGVLASATDLVQRVRELAVRGNNASLGADERAAIAVEVRQINEQLLSYANTHDANGDYLFGGYRTNDVPFTAAGGGAYTYNGDQGQRQLQIGPGRQVEVGDSGQDVFMNITAAAGGMRDIFQTLDNYATALEANAATPDILSDLDSAMDNFGTIRAKVGARLNAIDAQVDANDAFMLNVEKTLSEVTDLDYAEAVSRYNQQLVALEAAQQSYARLQNLSLFNYL
jgi:flagellar hook-associated protein 3 FlgL